MLCTFVHGKIHRIRITECNLGYNGSAEIDRHLLVAAGMAPYQQVQIVNLSNGQRFETYALPGGEGQFKLNGGAARLGQAGDDCLVIAYRQEESFSGATVVLVDPRNNSIAETMRYPADGEPPAE